MPGKSKPLSGANSNEVKTSLSGAYHAFDFSKYAYRYLAAIAYRFNRRFQLSTLPQRLLASATSIGLGQKLGYSY